MGPPAVGTARETISASALTFLSRTQPPATAKPQRHRLLPFPGAPGSAPSRLRHPRPIHSLSRPRPLNRRRYHWHSPEPIASSPPQHRYQSSPSGGGPSPVSFRLRPGPQDPFCLGRAGLGLSLRHFRGEAPASGPCLRVGSPVFLPAFHNFPPRERLLGRAVARASCFTLSVREA